MVLVNYIITMILFSGIQQWTKS